MTQKPTERFHATLLEHTVLVTCSSDVPDRPCWAADKVHGLGPWTLDRSPQAVRNRALNGEQEACAMTEQAYRLARCALLMGWRLVRRVV